MGSLVSKKFNIWFNNQPYSVEVIGEDLESDTVTLQFEGHGAMSIMPYRITISEFEKMKTEYLDKLNSLKIGDYNTSKYDSEIDMVQHHESKSNPYNKTNPAYYDSYGMQVLDMMEKIWGKDAVISFCRLNSFKYRMRMGTKENESFEDDLKKEQFYLNYAKKLEETL